MTQIHPVAAQAGAYVSGRPDYPPLVQDWLRAELALDPAKR